MKLENLSPPLQFRAIARPLCNLREHPRSRGILRVKLVRAPCIQRCGLHVPAAEIAGGAANQVAFLPTVINVNTAPGEKRDSKRTTENCGDNPEVDPLSSIDGSFQPLTLGVAVEEINRAAA